MWEDEEPLFRKAVHDALRDIVGRKHAIKKIIAHSSWKRPSAKINFARELRASFSNGWRIGLSLTFACGLRRHWHLLSVVLRARMRGCSKRGQLLAKWIVVAIRAPFAN
jgi:hypothetical protein